MPESIHGFSSMHSTTKAIIGFGSIWGLYLFGGAILGLFALGANDTAPERAALLLYGLTMLPTCILSIWFRKLAATWLLCLFPIAALGFIYQTIARPEPNTDFVSQATAIAGDLGFAAVPGLIGVLLLRSRPDKPLDGTNSRSST